jgi:DNA-binding transcriptional ArsR family regulator
MIDHNRYGNSASSTVPRPDPADRVFGVLSRGPRRQVLTRLAAGTADDGEPLELAEVTREFGDGDRFTIELHHAHLPKLTDAGYVEWNREQGTIRRGRNFAEIEPVLDVLTRNADELPGDWP